MRHRSKWCVEYGRLSCATGQSGLQHMKGRSKHVSRQSRQVCRLCELRVSCFRSDVLLSLSVERGQKSCLRHVRGPCDRLWTGFEVTLTALTRSGRVSQLCAQEGKTGLARLFKAPQGVRRGMSTRECDKGDMHMRISHKVMRGVSELLKPMSRVFKTCPKWQKWHEIHQKVTCCTSGI